MRRQDFDRIADGDPAERHRGAFRQRRAQMHDAVDAHLAAPADTSAVEDGGTGGDDQPTWRTNAKVTNQVCSTRRRRALRCARLRGGTRRPRKGTAARDRSDAGQGKKRGERP